MHHPESEAGAKSCVPSSFRVLRRHRAPHLWKKRVRGGKGDSGSGVGSPQRTTGEVKMRGGLTQRLARPFPRLSSQRSPAVGTVRRCSGLTDGRTPKGELAPAVAGVLGAEGGFGSNVWLKRTSLARGCGTSSTLAHLGVDQRGPGLPDTTSSLLPVLEGFQDIPRLIGCRSAILQISALRVLQCSYILPCRPHVRIHSSKHAVIPMPFMPRCPNPLLRALY